MNSGNIFKILMLFFHFPLCEFADINHTFNNPIVQFNLKNFIF